MFEYYTNPKTPHFLKICSVTLVNIFTLLFHVDVWLYRRLKTGLDIQMCYILLIFQDSTSVAVQFHDLVSAEPYMCIP